MWNPSNPCMHGQRTLNDNDDDDDDDDDDDVCQFQCHVAIICIIGGC